MANRSLGHRAPLLWLVLPFAAGLIWAKCAPAPGVMAGLAAAAAAGAIALWSAGRRRLLWAISLAFALGLAGAASYTLHRARLPAWTSLPPREARLHLRIERAFAPSFAGRASGLAVVTAAAPHLRDLIGQQVYFSLRLATGEAAPLRSEELAAIGVLRLLPENPPANTFEGYLANAGMNFVFDRGRIVSVVSPATAYRKFCARAADRFGALLGLGVEAKRPGLTDVFRAMMLGRKHDLSDEQNALFMRSGTMHLFAISGLHIGVIALGLQALLSLMRLPRRWRFGLSLPVLWLYVDVTGASPSATRAFCMIALLQAAFMLRKPVNPLAALTASALIVLVLDPMQLFSASFQMSYGIVAALLLLGLPLAETWLQRWPAFRDLPASAWRWWHHGTDWVWRGLLGALGIGLASILVSLLSGVQFFNLFTPGALPANLILIPVAMLVILAGMVSLLCGLAGFTAGSVLCNHAAVLILRGIDAGIRALVAWPGIYQAASFKAAWIGPAALVLLPACLLFGYAGGWGRARGGWWPPFVFTALVLIFGVNFG
jgi:competence protein ComEC